MITTPRNNLGAGVARLCGSSGRATQTFDLASARARDMDDDKYRAWFNDEARRFVVATNDGREFLEKMEAGKWETVKIFFTWTDDFDRALRLTLADVRKTFYKVVAAYSGPQLLCVE